MKRPEETNYYRLYPTVDQRLLESTSHIERLLATDTFEIPSWIDVSNELQDYLRTYGWQIVQVQEGINEYVRYLRPIE